MNWTTTTFDGMVGYTITCGLWRMIVITECGPRIAFLGRDDGRNLLYWNASGVVRHGWRLLGGHRVWLTRPMADESEDAYIPDNDPCQVQVEGRVLTATAPADASRRLERGMRIEATGEGCFTVTNFVRNAGDLIYSGGVWSPTCIAPEGCELRVPLGEADASWDLVTLVIPRVFAGNVVRLDDPQVTFEGSELVLRPQGQVAKRCMAAPQGTVMLVNPKDGVTFTKRVQWQRGASYPLGGCNVAVFAGQDNWMGELETFGIEQPIIPGQTIDNTEVWTISL